MCIILSGHTKGTALEPCPGPTPAAQYFDCSVSWPPLVQWNTGPDIPGLVSGQKPLLSFFLSYPTYCHLLLGLTDLYTLPFVKSLHCQSRARNFPRTGLSFLFCMGDEVGHCRVLVRIKMLFTQ